MSTPNDSTSSPIGKPVKSMAELRVELDLQQIKNNSDESPIIFADKIDDNFRHIEAALFGQESTPYGNAVILLEIKLSDEFPFTPPQSVIIKRAIMHPNIDECGKFLSNVLSGESWLPTMTIKDVLEHVWVRLIVPDINTIYCDPDRAKSYRVDPENFNRVARDYALKYSAAFS